MLQRLQQYKRQIVVGGIVIMAIAGALFAYKLFFYSKPATGIYSEAQPAPGMAAAPTHTTPPVKLKAYDKKAAGKLMDIPDIILSDPKIELTATGKVKPSEGGYTIGAVTDTTTGETKIITKEEARPLFGFGGKTEVGALAGVATGGNSGIIYARQDLLRVGSVNLGAVAGGGIIGDRAGAGAFIDVSVRW